MSNIIEILQELGEEESDNQIRSQEQKAFSHKVNIDDDIGEPKKYRNLINLLFSASPNDEFVLMINSPGGDLHSANAIIEAIKATEATVTAIILAECHSAASIIALSCHQIIVTDSAHMLVHTASWGTGGSTDNVKRHVEFMTKMVDKLIDRVYSGFLTPEELVACKKGTEFWFDAAEIGKRLKSRNDFTKSKTKPKPKQKLIE